MQLINIKHIPESLMKANVGRTARRRLCAAHAEVKTQHLGVWFSTVSYMGDSLERVSWDRISDTGNKIRKAA